MVYQWTTYREGDDVIIVETSAGYVWRIIDEIGKSYNVNQNWKKKNMMI